MRGFGVESLCGTDSQVLQRGWEVIAEVQASKASDRTEGPHAVCVPNRNRLAAYVGFTRFLESWKCATRRQFADYKVVSLIISRKKAEMILSG